MSVQRSLLGLVVLLVALSPLQYGGNRPWSMASLQVIAGIMALILAVQIVRDPLRWLTPLRPLALPFALAGLALAWAFVQAGAFTPASWHHPVWDLARQALGPGVGGAIAVDPAGALFKLQVNLSYIIVFAAAFLLAQDRAQGRWLLTLGAVVPSLYAVYGLALYALRAAHPPLPPVLEGIGPVAKTALSGPFANPAHFSLFLTMGIACSAVLLVKKAQSMRFGDTARVRASQGIDYATGVGLPILAILVLLLTATFLSGSRSGPAMALTCLGLLATVYWFKLTRQHRPVLMAGALILAIPAVMITFTLSGDHLSAELADNLGSGDFLGARLHIWGQSLNMIKDAPIFGVGLEGFDDLYPLYSEGGPPGYQFREAHNDYLGTAVSLGIPAAIAWFAALALIYARCLHGVIKRQKRVHYVLAPTVIATVAGLHALVDFSLEIPANAILLAVVLGVGCAQAGDGERSRQRQGLA